MNHVHVSAVSTLVAALQLIVVGFIFRTISSTWPESQLGKALAYVY